MCISNYVCTVPNESGHLQPALAPAPGTGGCPPILTLGLWGDGSRPCRPSRGNCGLASAALSLIEEDIGKVQRAEREYLLMDLAEVGVLCVEEHVELART